MAVREQLLEPQEEQRLVARRGQRQAPHRVDGEARHPRPAGEPHQRPVAHDVADPRGGDVVGAADHRPQQRAVAAVERAIRRPGAGRRSSASPSARWRSGTGWSSPRPHSRSPVRTAKVTVPCRFAAQAAAPATSGSQPCAVAGQASAASSIATARRRIGPRRYRRAMSHGPSTRAVHAGLPEPAQGRAVPAGPGARRALPPARRPAFDALRLRARRQPDLDGARARDRRAGRRPRPSSSPRAWPPWPPSCCRACAPATCSSRAATATRASARSSAADLEPKGIEVRMVRDRHRGDRRRRRRRDAGVGRDALQPAARRLRPRRRGRGGARARRAAGGRQHGRHAARRPAARPRRRLRR